MILQPDLLAIAKMTQSLEVIGIMIATVAEREDVIDDEKGLLIPSSAKGIEWIFPLTHRAAFFAGIPIPFKDEISEQGMTPAFGKTQSGKDGHDCLFKTARGSPSPEAAS